MIKMISECVKKIISVQEYMDLLEIRDNTVKNVGTIGYLLAFLREENKLYGCYEATENMAQKLIEENIPCVLVFDSSQSAYFEIPMKTVEKVCTTEFRYWKQEKYFAVHIADRYITISGGKDGMWEYSIYDAFYKLLKDGVCKESAGTEALNVVISDLLLLGGDLKGEITADSIIFPVPIDDVERRSVLMRGACIACTLDVCEAISQNKSLKRVVDGAIEKFINEDYGRVSKKEFAAGLLGFYKFDSTRELFVVKNMKYIVAGFSENSFKH